MNEVFGMSPTWNANVPSQRVQLQEPGVYISAGGTGRGRGGGGGGGVVDAGTKG